MKRLIIFLTMPLLFIACEKYEDRTYFKAVGVGYVYNKETKEPVPNAQVIVRSNFKSTGLAVKVPVSDYFYTDSTGFFKIKFLKRIDKRNVIYYSIWAQEGNSYMKGAPDLATEDLQKAKGTIQIDTLWLRYYHTGKFK